MSPQQVVDCDTQEGGCGGGDTISAYKYLIWQGGLDSWNSYPYQASQGDCRYTSNSVAKVSGWEYAGQTEADLVGFLVQYGPISICLDGSQWNGYSGGIMTPQQCGDTVDHCVLIVGYNMQGNTPYWIVRNSWGQDWGEAGYIYLLYGQNTCALMTEPTCAQVPQE